MNYEARCIELLEAYANKPPQPPYLLGGKSGMHPLADALGCRYLYMSNDWPTLATPAQPGPAHEPAVANLLIAAMHAFQKSCNHHAFLDDGFSILDGLTQNERWRECLKSIDDTKAMARLLMEFVLHSHYQHQLRSSVAPGVCKLITDWLRPDVPYDSCPAGSDLARAFYGDVWANLMLGDDSPRSKWDIPEIVAHTTPPFVHGLAPAQVDIEDTARPFHH